MASTVIRPVVRSFSSRFVRECAAWVRGGGHAVLWHGPRRAELVLPPPKAGDASDLSLFSILDLGKQRWRTAKEGDLTGLATCLVPRAALWIVERRIERDSEHPAPTRTVHIDCLECGACCESNEVILSDLDRERLRDGGRDDILRAPSLRRVDGKAMLALWPSGVCRQMGEGRMCGIYTVRPDACRDFPVASECCLYARELERGLFDGVLPHG